MVNNNSIHIKGPKDIRRLSQRVLNAILRTGEEVQHAGKIYNLGILWIKAYEIEKISDLEKRISLLETRGLK
jgi:hypothetical protein